MFDRFSIQVELTCFCITAFLAFCTEAFWMHWAVVAGIILTMMIVDFSFFEENTFIYDPEYNHWKDLSEPKEFQFKTD